VLIYNRKLTDAEILNYYCYGSIPSSGLVAHYPLDVDGRNISSEVVSPASTLDTSATGVPVYGESLLLPSIKSNTIIKNVSSSNSVSLTTATSANITYIDLPIGTWEVSGSVYFTPAATTTMTDLIAGTSLSSATLEPLNSTDDKISRAAGAGQTIVKSSPIRSVKVNVKSAARIFLVANATFAISTMTAYGELRASLQ